MHNLHHMAMYRTQFFLDLKINYGFYNKIAYMKKCITTSGIEKFPNIKGF